MKIKAFQKNLAYAKMHIVYMCVSMLIKNAKKNTEGYIPGYLHRFLFLGSRGSDRG